MQPHVPARLVPPPLRPDGEQGLGQTLQAQTGQSRPHGEPHVTGPGLSRRPRRPENQLGLLQGAVQQTHLREQEEEKKGGNKDLRYLAEKTHGGIKRATDEGEQGD